MPSARTPDASIASSTAGSSAPSSAGAASPPPPAGEAVRRTDSPPAGRLPRRLPSAGCGWSRSPAAGRPMTARYTAPRARRRARYPSPAHAPTWTWAHREEPSRPVLLSPSAPARPAAGTADPAVAWSRQFAQVVTEIMAGARSPRQIAPWTTERVRDRIILLTQTLSPGQKPRIRRIVTSRPAALRGGDDRRAQFRPAVPRAGATP